MLDHLGAAGRSAAADQPNFHDVAQAIWNNRRAGNIAQEAPAYAGSNDPNFQIDPMVKMAFLHGFTGEISKMDPKTAKIILSMPGNSLPAEGATK